MRTRSSRPSAAVLIGCCIVMFWASAGSAREYDFIQTDRNVALFVNLSGTVYGGLRVVFSGDVTPLQAFGIGTTLQLASVERGVLVYRGPISPRSTFEIDWPLAGPRIDAASWIGADGREIPIDVHSPYARMLYLIPRGTDACRSDCASYLPIGVRFSGRGSKDPDGLPLVRYLWVWSDGVALEGESVRRMFRLPGTYSVTLTVWDAEGLSHSATKLFTLYPCRCSGT